VLDFVPNAVHAGIYRALDAGHYEEIGLSLEIAEPSSTADTLQLVAAGRAELGIADAIDLATQIDRGRDLAAVMAILDRPAGGVIARKDSAVDRPRDLEGRTVGITGVPSDSAVLDTVLDGDGADPEAVDTVNLGFKGAQALEADRIDAFTGFVAADGAQLEHDGFPVRAFALDRWGGPSYPGLVVFSAGDTIAEEPELVQDFVSATARGYEQTVADPERSLEALIDRNPAIDPEIARIALGAYMPLLAQGDGRYGEIDAASVRQLSAWLVDAGLADDPIPPERFGAVSGG
jgi:putative hydroxymethylpyrimidine transport system substrate-binding protein